MSHKAKFSWVFLTVTAFCVLVLFNNCQPMEPVGGSDNGGSVAPGPGPGPGGSNISAGENYFNKTLKPLFGNGENGFSCVGCHESLPAQGLCNPTNPPQIGFSCPAITSYSFMKSRLETITDPINNQLYNSTAGRGPAVPGFNVHTNYCGGDVGGSVSPCLELVSWMKIEKPSLSVSGIVGSIESVDVFGVVSGYAIDLNNRSTAIQVVAYFNGPVGTGELIGSFLANGAASAGTIQNGHKFTFNLAPQYRPGALRQIYIYAGTAAENNKLPNSPRGYIAHTPTAAGLDYFTQTVSPRITQNCSGCHGNDWNDYKRSFSRLVGPDSTTFAIGSATNNSLYSHARGVDHPVNLCNGNNSICDLFVNWWNLEF
jgi:cytochrome c553